jgi:hypothetical protein
LSHDVDRIDAQTAGLCSGGGCSGENDLGLLSILLGFGYRQRRRSLLPKKASEAAHVDRRGGVENGLTDKCTGVWLDISP